MLLDFEAYREYHLVFMDTQYPLDWMFKDGFKHVYCIERQALGWTCIDPSQSDLYTTILPANYGTDVMTTFKQKNPTFKILKLHVKPHTLMVYPRAGIISCVSVMQQMLGVYWPFVFSPFQLYNRIVTRTPTHIEVIEWHDIKSTQHKGKLRPQPPKHNKYVKN